MDYVLHNGLRENIVPVEQLSNVVEKVSLFSCRHLYIFYKKKLKKNDYPVKFYVCKDDLLESATLIANIFINCGWLVPMFIVQS